MNCSAAPWLVCALLALGCGAARGTQTPAPGAGAAPEPAGADTEAGESEGDDAPASEPAGYGQSTPSGGFAQPPGQDSAVRAQPSLERAWQGFEAAARELSDAGADCRLACKALASMRRSKERICELEDADGESCSRAKQRLESAEKRVHGTCTCSETP